MNLQLLLLFTKLSCFSTGNRNKRLGSKDFHHCRSPLACCQQFIFFICPLHCPQLSADKITVQEKRTVISVIVIILGIGNRSIISDSRLLPFIYHMDSRPIDYRFQTHFPKLLYCCPDHPFKSHTVSNIHCFFLCNIFSCGDKSNPVAFRKSPGHRLNFFF